jgi:pyruvate,water dikinase
VLRVLMNADLDEAIGFLAPPPATSHHAGGCCRGIASEQHWRWRLRMAERIAARIDAGRFGVKGMYVFGSTKNATAGPTSDIDLHRARSRQ